MLSLSINAIKKCVTASFSSKYLLYTNTGISMVMSCAGDGLQQYIQLGKKEITSWNQGRSRNVALFGLLIGPACHYWYIFLDRFLPGRSFQIVAKKIIVDQFVGSPVAIGAYLFVTSYFEGKRNKDLKEEVLQKGWKLYKAEWLVWPPAQTINFYLVPLKYRVLFDNTVAFSFDWYYSYVKYGMTSEKDKGSKQKEECQSSDEDDLIPNIRHPGSHLPPLYLHNTVIEHKHNAHKNPSETCEKG